MKELITWRQVRAGDEVRATLEDSPVNIEWVAHDYDIANSAPLVIFNGTYGIGVISASKEVWKTGHDFKLAARQKHPFQGVEAAFEDTDLVRSYRLWQAADDKWAAVSKLWSCTWFSSPGSHILQSFYENVLTQPERDAWDLWVSGGSATPDQWAAIRAARLEGAQ
jgi:hypothetical protein